MFARYPLAECSATLEENEDNSGALHGQYHQDKRALRGARASSGGDRDTGWQAEADLETTDGGTGAITLSSLPRGYWATLFNLEVVKARNRPTEPPKKPEAAPFFLSTVHREGEAAPSFPEMGSAPASAATRKEKSHVAVESKEIKMSAHPAPGEDDDVPDLPAGGDGAWSDDDDEEVDGGRAEEAVSADGKRERPSDAEETFGSTINPRRSRILKQMKKSAKVGGRTVSRCGLADLLLECDEAGLDAMDEDGHQDEETEAEGVRGVRGSGERKFEAVMTYLKRLAPPMVDVDISLLCQGEWDEEGIHLVKLALHFLLEEIRWVSVRLSTAFG